MRRTRVSPLLLAEDRSTVQGGSLPGVVTPAPSRGGAPICDSERRGAPGLAALASRRPPSSTERWRDSRDVAGAALGNSASPVAPVAPPPSPRRRHCGDSDIRLRRGECWLARGVACMGANPECQQVGRPKRRSWLRCQLRPGDRCPVGVSAARCREQAGVTEPAADASGRAGRPARRPGHVAVGG